MYRRTILSRLLKLGVLASVILFSCEREDDPEKPSGSVALNPATGTVFIVSDSFQNTPLVVVGSHDLNFVVSFVNSGSEEFTPVQDQLPIVMKSSDETQWNVFGEAISGPRIGEKLPSPNSLMGFWMTFGAFYPGTAIYQGALPNNQEELETSSDPLWSIPRNRVFDGGPGKDGIPALENMNFAPIDEIHYLDPKDLVVGFKAGDDVRAYPHRILDWHEIANDVLNGDVYVAINYCPLTGTASAWNRNLNNSITTFGVSGLLYNTNLMPYDRDSDSYWSQMRFDCVNGNRLGQNAETLMVVETTWETWASMYPNSQVATTQTGFNRDYSRYPYGDYRTNDDNIIFPLELDDTRLGRKDRVHGVIIDGKAKVYPLNLF